jgi:hypothetical protein
MVSGRLWQAHLFCNFENGSRIERQQQPQKWLGSRCPGYVGDNRQVDSRQK